MGALAFEHDLRGMTAYLTGLTTFGDIKDKFVRLRQISDLLNLGSVSVSCATLDDCFSMKSLVRTRTWTIITTLLEKGGEWARTKRGQSQL